MDPEEFMRSFQRALDCCKESTEAELILAAKRIPLHSVTNIIDSLVSSYYHHAEVPPSFLEPVRFTFPAALATHAGPHWCAPATCSAP